jgi:hypothetical protein
MPGHWGWRSDRHRTNEQCRGVPAAYARSLVCGVTALVVDFRTRAAERKKLADSLDMKFFVEDRPAPGADSYAVVRSEIAAA